MRTVKSTKFAEEVDAMYANLLAINDKIRMRIMPTLQGQLRKARAEALSRYPAQNMMTQERRPAGLAIMPRPLVDNMRMPADPIKLRKRPAPETPVSTQRMKAETPPLPERQRAKVPHLRLRKGFAPFFAHVHEIDQREKIDRYVRPVRMDKPTPTEEQLK